MGLLHIHRQPFHQAARKRDVSDVTTEHQQKLTVLDMNTLGARVAYGRAPPLPLPHSRAPPEETITLANGQTVHVTREENGMRYARSLMEAGVKDVPEPSLKVRY